MMQAFCQHCRKQFMVQAGSKGKFCSLSCGTSFRNQENKKLKEIKYLELPNKCQNCKKELMYHQRNNKYCSNSCAAQITNKVPRKRGPTAKEKHQFSRIKFLLCDKTNKWYSNRNKDGSFRRCSPYIKTDKQKYYMEARFKFNVYNFPEKFDINLINTYGWYSCPGKKRKNSPKNVNGVSRDHLVSISYGFKNNIDPKIISHPANCQIVLHSENKRKSENCKITLDELLERIKNW